VPCNFISNISEFFHCTQCTAQSYLRFWRQYTFCAQSICMMVFPLPVGIQLPVSWYPLSVGWSCAERSENNKDMIQSYNLLSIFVPSKTNILYDRYCTSYLENNCYCTYIIGNKYLLYLNMSNPQVRYRTYVTVNQIA
jgi:hypothetical protein